ncbi:MAG: SpoIIE family protein phosphatase [Prevotella sp.]|nr:SpoIIE family protein phosphatase [Prevotella sp.]
MPVLKRNIIILIGIIGGFLSMQAQAMSELERERIELEEINALIIESRNKHLDVDLALSLCQRIVFFYNHTMDDSVFYHAPKDLIEIRNTKQWNKYYETWTYLVNAYLYSGRTNSALREVQAVFEDAKQRDNKYGMGIAYYTMGSVYASMNNLDESVKSYQKGLDILLKIRPYPSIIPDVYSYYGDILNMRHEYAKLEKLTENWGSFLDEYVKNMSFPEGKPDSLKVEHLSPETIKTLYSYYNIACAQSALGLGQLEKAEKMLEQAHSNLVTENESVGHSWLYYLTALRTQQGRYQEALELNTKRLKIAEEENDMTTYIDIIHQRADIMKALGRYQEAADYYLRMYAINDSVNALDTKRQLTEMNTLFHVDELKMEQERAQFRNTLIIVGLIVLALIIFSIFRYIAAKRLKVAHEKLQTTHEELLTAYDQLEETTIAKERIESDLRIARNIQMGMVPHTFPDRPDIDLYASMTPAKEVGGDLYGYLLLPAKTEGVGDKLYFALGDVSGKGVPASLFMAQATRLFLTLAKQQMMPAEICTRMNDALSGEDNETGMFVTMFIGLIDLQSGHLDFCNAGHNPPVLLGKKTEFIEMISNAPIGLFPELDYEGEEISDICGKPFFVYTDGLNEAENRQQEQFSDERLLEILETTPFVSSQKTIELLVEEVEKHRDGAEPNDDLTMLCVKVKGNKSN